MEYVFILWVHRCGTHAFVGASVQSITCFVLFVSFIWQFNGDFLHFLLLMNVAFMNSACSRYLLLLKVVGCDSHMLQSEIAAQC